MTGVVAIVATAALFAAFGLLRAGRERERCGGCASACLCQLRQKDPPRNPEGSA